MNFGFKIKPVIIFILALFAVSTVVFCLKSPKMHKPFQLNIIEYIIKINTDGSVTSTKNVTTTLIKKENE